MGQMRAVFALGIGFAAAAVLVACVPNEQPVSGQALYSEYCAACHGDTGRGNGPAAAALRPRPPDLTGLAARNRGSFPMLAVMGKVYGYSRGEGGGGGPMPEFGPLLEGESVLYDAGDGIPTPTPVRLIELAEYVRSLQRPAD
jgi:mono/diheme cytochrome c family protein